MLDRSDRLTTKALNAARRKLLETGTRNRLIHVNRENARANCLNIINERSDDVFSLLRDQEKRLRFKATGKDRKKGGDGEDQFPLLAEEGETGGAVGPDRYTDQFQETPLGPEAQGHRRFHRIWSTDWFHRREHEVRRLADALLRAKEASADGMPVRGANSGGVLQAAVLVEANTAPIDIGHLDLSAPAYRRAELSVRSTVEPHEAPQGQIGDLIVKIVDIEGPIHVDEIARRIASAFGKARTGGRMVDTTLRALHGVLRRADTRLCRVGQFVLTHAQAASPPIRDRRAETGAIFKAEYLPPMEVTAAAARDRAESGLMPPEEMTKAVARLLCYQRVGPDLSATIFACVMQNETRGA